MKDIKCPYCNGEIDINHDDGYGYEEGELYNQECPLCDKVFTYRTSISFHYKAEKSDCLNWGSHVWKKTNTIPEEYSRLRCVTCGEEKPLEKSIGD